MSVYSHVCTPVTELTFLPMVSHCPTDPQVAVTRQETQQSASKGRQEEEDW